MHVTQLCRKPRTITVVIQQLDPMENTECKKWYLSKTLWFNIATTIVAITAGLGGVLPILAPVVSEVSMAWILFGVGVVNVVLRTVTDKGLGQ